MCRSDVLITGRLLIAVCARNMEDFCSGVNGRGVSPAHKGHSFISHWQRVRLFVLLMIWHSKGSALALKCTVHMAHLEKKKLLWWRMFSLLLTCQRCSSSHVFAIFFVHFL